MESLSGAEVRGLLLWISRGEGLLVKNDNFWEILLMEALRGDEGHSSGIGVAIDSILLLEEIGRWVRRIKTCSAAHLAMG